MRIARVTLVLALAGGLGACGGEEEATAPAAAAATAPVEIQQAQADQNTVPAPANVLSRFGGALIAASEHFIEVLPFTGGAFLYIAASDLIPEIRKEKRTRPALILLAAFAAGIALMLFIPEGEAGHAH